MRHRYGMVHGRFQPFHSGHLEYVLAAFQRCERLIVGITNPDPSLIVAEATDAERHKPEANLFTFFERQLMIHAALVEAGVGLSRISVVPFPIHHPERWRFYCPYETVVFMRLYSDWGKEKLRRFRERGWTVEILDPGVAKQVSGSEVRHRLQTGQEWEALVPPAVATVLKDLGAAERLKRDQGPGIGER
jgi:cytidyltransferase-like protein